MVITELQEHRFINKQVVVSDASIRELQENVVESHAMRPFRPCRPSSRSLLRLLAEEGFYKKRLLLSSASSRRVRLDCAGDRELSEHHQARGGGGFRLLGGLQTSEWALSIFSSLLLVVPGF